jgi:hypothetical protein
LGFSWLFGNGVLDPANLEAANPPERKVGPGITYFNDIVPDVPWSIQVIKVERAPSDLQLIPTLGRASVQGLSTLSQQLKRLPSDLGTPVVAVNGDFYQTEGGVGAGDPRGLEIILGELISGPTGSASFGSIPPINQDGAHGFQVQNSLAGRRNPAVWFE